MNAIAPVLHRQPPGSLQIEQALLGMLLTNNGHFEAVSEFLAPEHFLDPRHGRLYRDIAGEIDAGRPVMASTLVERYRNDPQPPCDQAYMAGLLVAVVGMLPSIARQYATMIAEAWRRREIIEVASMMIDRAYDASDGISAEDVQNEGEAELARIADAGGGGHQLQTAGDAINGALADLDAALQRGDGLVGVGSGYAGIDRMTGGFRPGQLVVLGARPSMGKTALLTGVAMRTAALGNRVLIISAEMRAAELGARMVAALSGLPCDAVLKGRIEVDVDHPDGRRRAFREVRQSEVDQMVHAQRRASVLPVLIDDRSSPTLAAIRSRVMRERRNGLGLVIIDYIGLLKASAQAARYANRTMEITELSAGLKALAKDAGVPVIVLSQLSREVEKREDKTPVMSDLRDSGSLEQDADVVMFLYREHYYLTRNEPTRRQNERQDTYTARCEEWMQACQRSAGQAQLIIAKQRGGAVGTVRLRFDDHTTWFRDERDGPDAVPQMGGM